MKANQHKLVATISLCAAIVIPNIASAVAVSGQGTWESTLQGRDLDGDLSTFEAYYDTMLDITWLADANYASTPMDWVNANAWVASLNPYGSGIIGWRLPTITDTGTSGCNLAYSGTDCGWNVDTTNSELAHMFYMSMGDKASHTTSGNWPQDGYGLTNSGPFANVNRYYWSATELAGAYPNYYRAWYFDFDDGSQNIVDKSNLLGVWAVHTGDVGASAVPVPAAAWLFGSGLLGLIGVAKRRALE